MSARPPERTCVACAFFHGYAKKTDHAALGECRVAPPVMLGEDSRVAYWPPVGEGDFCAEFAPTVVA